MIDLNTGMMGLLDFGDDFLVDNSLKLIVDRLDILGLDVVDSVDFVDSGFDVYCAGLDVTCEGLLGI
jgi:hypothetical protein